MPTAFRLLLTGMPSHESPRLHGGGLYVGATCTSACRLHVHGYISIRGRRLGLRPRTLTFAGSRHLHIAPGSGTRRLLAHLLTGKRTGVAHLTFTAAHVGPITTATNGSPEATSGSAEVRLLA